MKKNAGLTLVELMIAMVLGLLITAGAISLFQANQQTFRSNQSLIQIQESTRTTFEIMSRDLRQVGYISCGTGLHKANVLNPQARNNLMEWSELRGYDGDTEALPVSFGQKYGQRLEGTSAILIQGMEWDTQRISTHNPNTAQFQLASGSVGFTEGDILIACNQAQASIFQVTDSTGITFEYRPGAHLTGPGNCTAALGLPVDCNNTLPTANITYGNDAIVARFFSAIWYVGHNNNTREGSYSLFRARLDRFGDAAIEELVQGVNDLQIFYHQANTDTWDTAKTIDNANAWPTVDSVNMSFTLAAPATSSSTSSSTQGGLKRTFNHIVALRNRIR